jgi:DNA-binding NarL/FixJ family response regulator
MSLTLDEQEAILELMWLGMTLKEISEQTNIEKKRIKKFLATRKESDGSDRR